MTSFSIVIPTRDRADLVGAAVRSALTQFGHDVEVIVSDNSSSDGHQKATSEALAAWRGDDRFRYIRPESPMTMPDHWEFATRHARNDYVLVLTDRLFMRPRTLDIISDLIGHDALERPDTVMWSGAAGLTPDGVFTDHPYTGTCRMRASSDVLREFASADHWRSGLIGCNNLPRSLNSAVKRTVLEDIRRARSAVYLPLSPDYTGAFLQLIHGKTQVEIDLPLYASHGSQSNGQKSLVNGIRHYSDQFNVDPFEGCPLPLDTVINSIFRDYEFIGRSSEKQLPKVDIVNYLLLNWRELRIKQELASTLDLDAMRRMILAKAKSLSQEEQARFAEGVATIDSDKPVRWYLRNLLYRFGLLDRVRGLFQRAGMHDRGPLFRDIFEAVAANPLRWDGMRE